MNVIIDLKDLSLQTWKTKSAWNELAAASDDFLFLRYDSIQHLLEMKTKWFKKAEELDDAFKLLSTHAQTKVLPDSLKEELEHAYYIWNFSKQRIYNANNILDKLIKEKELYQLILVTGRPSLYENIQELSFNDYSSYEEKSIYRQFTANMAVFDMTKDGFQNILLMVNDEIPPILEKRILTISIFSIFLFFLTIFYTFISLGRIAKPIARLASAMTNIGKMDYQVSPIDDENSYEDDEIVIINKGIHEMIYRIKKLYDQNIIIEKEKQNARLKALQYQINPHFLYNTLGSIQLAASLEKRDRLASVIKSMSCLLHKTLKNTYDLATIFDELALVDDYIDIMQFRYNERINIIKEIDTTLYPLYIPGRIIQPVLENAIQHGLNEKLNNKESSAQISIIVQMKSQNLNLKISDNGTGMDSETIQNIFTKLRRNDDSQIGLLNINQRIKLRLGNSYGIKIKSNLNKGTEITLVLPVIRSINE